MLFLRNRSCSSFLSLTSLAGLLSLSVLSAAANAQFDDFADSLPGAEGTAALSAMQWIVRAAGALAIALLGFFFSFYGVFSWLLTTRRRLWPLTAFGRASALANLFVWASILICFWPQLVLPGRGYLNQYGLRGGLLLGALLTSFIFRVLFRSRHQAVAAARG